MDVDGGKGRYESRVLYSSQFLKASGLFSVFFIVSSTDTLCFKKYIVV